MKQKNWNIGDLNKGQSLPTNVRIKISETIKLGYLQGRKVWNDGLSMPEETRRKISKSKKGTRVWNKGVPRTLEERKKISDAKKGLPAWNKGKFRTDEEKSKMSEGAKRMWVRRKKLFKAL